MVELLNATHPSRAHGTLALPSASRANNRRDDSTGAGSRKNPGSGRSGSSSRSAQRSGARASGKAKVPESVEVLLVHARWRHFTWSLASLVIGGVLLFKLGTVGKMMGGLVIVLAARSAYQFIRTLRHPAGTIRVSRDQIILPDGLCQGTEQTLDIEKTHHAFMLRRAVPWTQTAPVLIIETDDRAFTYPRDWFASESDQRRVLQTIDHHRHDRQDRSGQDGDAADRVEDTAGAQEPPAASST